MGENRV